MRAAVLEEFKQPVNLRTDVAEPEPGSREVVVRTRAAGICRTDLKVIDGVIPTVETPRVLGHEVAGEVAAVGAGVEAFREGDRVTVSLDVTCGVCAYCQVGEFDHCARLRRLGLEWDGGLADYVRVPAENLVPIADSVSFAEAAVIPDAVGSRARRPGAGDPNAPGTRAGSAQPKRKTARPMTEPSRSRSSPSLIWSSSSSCPMIGRIRPSPTSWVASRRSRRVEPREPMTATSS